MLELLYSLYRKIILKKRIRGLKKIKPQIDKIAIVYYIPKTNIEKYNNWEDGFTKAMALLSKKFEIKWYNLEDYKPTAEELNNYDLIIAKSCWNWVVDDYIKSLTGLNTFTAIAVSCSKPPAYREDKWRYDIIFYETEDYAVYLGIHPNKHQAFGVNTDVFYPEKIEKIIDVLSIGGLEEYKRFEKLNDIEGKRKVIIGDKNTKNAPKVIQKLNPSIEIIDYTTQKELAKYINSSSLVYIPSTIDGGGERAVLEAKACGVPVKIESDNLKLKKLLSSQKDYSIKGYYLSIYNAIKSI